MTVMNVDEQYMRRALQLAVRGMGRTSPNPMVGAVVVAADGRIIGEGFHRLCGQAHAEVNAIAAVSDADRPLLADSTIYVTLEPCSHWGKTPPCARLIIDTGIPRVVVGSMDPFPAVSGRGVAMLREAGVEVVTGVLDDECRALNLRFMTAHERQRPFVTLKWAQSADGFIDSDRPEGHPERFSTPLTSMLTHRLRSLHDAILVGSGTALNDFPRLDTRLWPSGRDPRPVILDRRGRVHTSTTKHPPLILDDCADVPTILTRLYAEGITSVLVEGGAQVLQAFIDSGVWDAARVETSPCALGAHGTVCAPRISEAPVAHAGPFTYYRHVVESL